MNNPLVEFYRCSEAVVACPSPDNSQARAGYCNVGPLSDLARYVASDGSTLRLPFDLCTIIDNLRFERYPTSHGGTTAILSTETARRAYYCARPLLTDGLRKRVQRLFLRDWQRLPFPRWPVDTTVENILETVLASSIVTRKLDSIPFIWFWPNGACSAAIMTHDVETAAGVDLIPRLIDIDESFGVRSSFQLVPEERYTVSRGLIEAIRHRHCEVNVHGLNHNGNLFRDRTTFLKQARCINRYVEDYHAEGFRAACMYRNLEWYGALNIAYDMSVPNVAHLEPQRGGCCTVFPYFIGKTLELPLTTVQDYSLFNILGDYSTALWKQQIALITQSHGLISFIIHPDYIFQPRALDIYEELLGYLSFSAAKKNIWMARPGEVNRWWRQRAAMTLVQKDGKWQIEGVGSERARIACATVCEGKLVYSLSGGEREDARTSDYCRASA